MATPEENREADIKTREALMTPEERADFPLPPSDVASPNYVPTSTNQGIGGDLSVPETTQFNADQSRGTATVEYMREQAKQEKEEADRLKKEKEAAEKEQEKAPGTFQKFAESLGFKSEQDKRAEAEDITGIKPAEYFAERAAEIAEMDALYTDYNNTVARRDQALLSKEEQMGGYLGSILDGEKSIINKAYNIELSRKSAQINTKLAIMEMKQENFAEAQAFIDDAVNDYMAPIKDDYAVFQQFREEQADKIAGLDNEYKEAMDKQDAYKLAILQEEESRVTQVGEMMKQYFNAGITLDDTVAEANEKAARWSGAQPKEGNWQIINKDGQVYRVDPNTGVMESLGTIGGVSDGMFNDKERDEISLFTTDMLTKVGADGNTVNKTEEEARASFDALKSILSSKFGERGEEAIGVLASALDKSFPPKGTVPTVPVSTPGFDRITGRSTTGETDFSKLTVGKTKIDPRRFSGVLELDENGVLVPPEQTFINNLLGL